MLGFWFSALALLTSLHGALALPAAQSRVSPRTVTTLTAAQLAGYADYTELARAAYCAPTSIEKWSCGRELAPSGTAVTTNSGRRGM
jgi:hypothetical protein